MCGSLHKFEYNNSLGAHLDLILSHRRIEHFNSENSKSNVQFLAAIHLTYRMAHFFCGFLAINDLSFAEKNGENITLKVRLSANFHLCYNRLLYDVMGDTTINFLALPLVIYILIMKLSVT